MSYTYASLSSALALMLEIDETDPNFGAMLPNAIIYTEQRLNRDLDTLNKVKRDSSSSLTPSNRTFSLPTSLGNFRTVKSVNVITPAGTAAAAGTRNPLRPVSQDVVDTLYPEDALHTGLPVHYAQLDNNTIIVGPAPDAAYVVEVRGTIQPTPLSAANTSTYLSTTYPDLYFAACMIFGAGYKRNFGAQSEDPKMALSWESTYQSLLPSAVAEEGRRKSDS